MERKSGNLGRRVRGFPAQQRRLYQPLRNIMSIAEYTANMATVAVDELLGVIERIERLEIKKAAIAGEMRDVFAEAKGSGFDVKAIREIVKIRKLDAAVREEQEAMVDVYKRALGMASDLNERQEAA